MNALIIYNHFTLMGIIIVQYSYSPHVCIMKMTFTWQFLLATHSRLIKDWLHESDIVKGALAGYMTLYLTSLNKRKITGPLNEVQHIIFIETLSVTL